MTGEILDALPARRGHFLLWTLLWNYGLRPSEERDLLRRFGAEYADCRDRVRCWIPALRPYPHADASVPLVPSGADSVKRRYFAPMLVVLAGCYPPPANLAVPGEPLRPCPSTPNCVSTEAVDARHSIPAIAFRGTPETALAHARQALLGEPRTRIVLEAPGYLRAESRSRLFRFVDDVEMSVDGTARVVRFRSASRVGRSDLGVNRARMQRFTARFRALNGPPPSE